MADIDAPLAWRMQQDGYLMQINQLREENAKLREFLSKIGPSNEMRELVASLDLHDEQLDRELNAARRRNFEEVKTSKLQSENAKLREVLLDLADLLGKNVNLRELYKENTNLQSENERLRKLILDIWNDAIRFDDFWDYVTDDGELYNKNELPHYQERMRELGIRVN